MLRFLPFSVASPRPRQCDCSHGPRSKAACWSSQTWRSHRASTACGPETWSSPLPCRPWPRACVATMRSIVLRSDGPGERAAALLYVQWRSVDITSMNKCECTRTLREWCRCIYSRPFPRHLASPPRNSTPAKSRGTPSREIDQMTPIPCPRYRKLKCLPPSRKKLRHAHAARPCRRGVIMTRRR